MLFKFFNLLILSFLLSNTALAAYPDYDEYGVEENVDMAAFSIGESYNTGSFYFIVIRTTNQCFIENHKTFTTSGTSGLSGTYGGGGVGVGLASVNCDSLKKIPSIKIYLETGKRP